MIKGIDVSEYQGIIDWKKVKAAGCRFAVLRAVRRDGSADMQFEANVRGCLEKDRKSTRLNSSHSGESRMPSSA